jgi:hypothetical protein
MKSVIFQICDFNHYFETMSLKCPDRINEFLDRIACNKTALVICSLTYFGLCIIRSLNWESKGYAYRILTSALLKKSRIILLSKLSDNTLYLLYVCNFISFLKDNTLLPNVKMFRELSTVYSETHTKHKQCMDQM